MMRQALITTTIHDPVVLELYRQHGRDVRFFVALDTKSVPPTILALDKNTIFLTPDDQKNLDYSCSELIGWSNIGRRNLALLEAIKWGADLITTVDDDVNPVQEHFGPTYFDSLVCLFEYPFNGIQVSSSNGWYDPGQLLTPAVRHRGLPIEVPTIAPKLSPITGARVGVAAGLWMGDADVDATHRIANPPAVYAPTELARTGVIVHPDTRTVFNSQSTTFLRELAPAMFMSPGLLRYDDIFGSLITQRIARDRGLAIHFGRPFAACWQDRSKASLLRDLDDELWGMEFVLLFSQYLDKNPTEGRSTIEYLRWMYDDLKRCKWWPGGASDPALAFLDDVEPLL